MPFAENAIGSKSYKPGDILRAMNGLSVQINNTDAEGRLVMADTMTYAQRNYSPEKVTYISTLTGACMVALGLKTAGLFCPDYEMVVKYIEASKYANEPIWHMPIEDEHREDIKGKDGTDLLNCGKSMRWGGACTAAAFLEKFIEDKRPWAHLDIAGPALAIDGDATGFGAKLLLSYLAEKGEGTLDNKS